MSAILARDVVTNGGRSFRRELAVRSFAQTGPPSSCLVAEETRLHLLADGRWVLEAWNYGEEGVDRRFRVVDEQRASWWLRRNGFEDETLAADPAAAVTRSQPATGSTLPWRGLVEKADAPVRGSGFVSAAAIAASALSSLPIELESAG